MKTLLLSSALVVAGLWLFIQKFWLQSEDAIHLSHYLPDRDHV
ncbi:MULTISPECIES: hypothetical protein [Chromobacterium]|jgi:hypothetical protein|uniref:Uncharacterized protein n=1 Tax=Chromobacterium amazonense TaxID=1382803 RepID=A0ABU8UZE3_9NEIS|nr:MULTISPECIES: hypothetical protein [Chromobacterium]MDE1711444.1 hypothetical protein [Chromobacterium amazonense]MDQ4541945.1 hypothetical protein [Chromobacterium amazonense]